MGVACLGARGSALRSPHAPCDGNAPRLESPVGDRVDRRAVNYAFVAVWIAELIWWRASPAKYLSRPPSAAWSVRTFYLIVLFNAAVVFVSGFRALAGLLLIAWLLWIWRPSSR